MSTAPLPRAAPVERKQRACRIAARPGSAEVPPPYRPVPRISRAACLIDAPGGP